jgi:hypothetical protein
MENLSIYESFNFSNWHKKPDSDPEEEATERLREMIGELKEDIQRHFRTRTMDSDFVEIDNPTEFVVEYFPKSFDGRVPKRISYYLDDLAEFLSEELGVKVDWDFSPNGNVQRVVFTLEKEIDPKFFKVKQSLKIS